MTEDAMSVLPAERAAATRSEEEHYQRVLVLSQHPPEIEAVIAVACGLHIERNRAYVQYLQSSDRARPGRQGRSRAWGEAEAARFGAVQALAAALGAAYRSPTGHPPISQAEALIEQRVGPLCVGWDADGTLHHHPNDNCPVHPRTERPR